MGPFGFGKPQKRVEGSIGYFGLEDWWLTSFSEDERRHIIRTFQPLGSSGDSLTSGAINYTSETAVGLLQALAGWFTKDEDRPIAHKILEKAAELSRSGTPVLDPHFLYQQMVQIYYKDRDKPEYMAKAVHACRQQIALAPEAARAFRAEYGDSPLPAHRGYEQLAIILEKEGRFQDAIALSRQAESEGWSGDWRRRIERCEKKLAKA